MSSRAWKQKKPTPLDRGPPLHVNRPLFYRWWKNSLIVFCLFVCLFFSFCVLNETISSVQRKLFKEYCVYRDQKIRNGPRWFHFKLINLLRQSRLGRLSKVRRCWQVGPVSQSFWALIKYSFLQSFLCKPITTAICLWHGILSIHETLVDFICCWFPTASTRNTKGAIFPYLRVISSLPTTQVRGNLKWILSTIKKCSEKIRTPRGNRTHDLPDTGKTL